MFGGLGLLVSPHYQYFYFQMVISSEGIASKNIPTPEGAGDSRAVIFSEDTTMSWYADLAACDYFGETASGCLKAVGWLERGKDFPKGNIDKQVYDRLAELLQDPFQPAIFMGFHECDLCQFPGKHMGTSNLLLPGHHSIYVCPELILHYIDVHWYKPPEEFCHAVLSCPAIRTMEYKKLLLKNGGGALLSERK